MAKDSMIKFGVPTHMYPRPDFLIEQAKKVEEAGFDAIGFADHLMQCEKKLEYLTTLNCYMVLQAWAMATKKLMMLTTVSDPHRIHPAVLGQIVATLDHFSKGRAAIGFGAGEAMNLNPYGIEWDHPVSRMEEHIKVLKMLWKDPGPHDYEGRFYKLKNAYRPLKPVQEPHPPVWIAANRPRTRKILGELGDGWFPIRLLPPKYTEFLNEIKGHAKKAGRDPEAIVPGLFMRTACSKDGDEARTHIPEAKPSLLYSPEKLELAGWKVPKEFWDYDHAALEVTPESVMRRYELAQLIPEKLITGFYPFGTPDDCIAHLEKYVKAGCRFFWISFMGTDETVMKSIDLYGKYVIPHFKE